MAPGGWRCTAALLCAYGFLKEMRPAEPFVTPFLTGPDKNLTLAQVNQDIFPVSTYSMMALLVVTFLVTDWLRNKPVIVAQGLSAIAVYCLLIWGNGVPTMQVLEVLYGTMMATDVAYFTYMYAQVSKEHYSLVSGLARVAFLLGRFLSGVVSQLTVSTGALSYMDLHYVTLGVEIAATLVALCLPTPRLSFYFHRDDNMQSEAQLASSGERSTSALKPTGRVSVAQLLWADFKNAYTNFYVLRWSAWWALATCGQMQVLTYVQVLWGNVMDETGTAEKPLNGAVEAAYTLLGAIGAWLTTRLPSWWWRSWGGPLLGGWSLMAGGLVLLMASSSDILLQYCVYCLFGIIYHSVITIASSEVAQQVPTDSHGLVFGVNQLCALVLQSLLTLMVAGQAGLKLSIRQQFNVYGGYFIVLGVAFLVFAVWSPLRRKCKKNT